jgi:cold shock CspA family protein/ribosome-associated translation inhibitor RaiA
MELPLQVAFRNMSHSDVIEPLVREKASRLDRFADHILGCRVVVGLAGKHHVYGNLYEVRIDLTVPGEEIAVTREPGEHPEYRDVEVALRDAFDATCRRLEDHVRRRRGLVKAHGVPPHGRVTKLFPDEGYGFLETPDGREVYFHRHSVLHDGFNRLHVGSDVVFVEEEGNKGLQASTVRPVGRHHHV